MNGVIYITSIRELLVDLGHALRVVRVHDNTVATRGAVSSTGPVLTTALLVEGSDLGSRAAGPVSGRAVGSR